VACRGMPFDLLDVLPTVLRGVVLDFNWSRKLLWGLDLRAGHVPVADLRWLLSMPVWSFEGEHFKVSPAQVRADPVRYQIHYVQALATDLSFPLHVLVRADRVVTVLDGFHRLLKADLTGQEVLAVKKVAEDQLGRIACTC
jgi:hypothetical protein